MHEILITFGKSLRKSLIASNCDIYKDIRLSIVICLKCMEVALFITFGLESNMFSICIVYISHITSCINRLYKYFPFDYTVLYVMSYII